MFPRAAGPHGIQAGGWCSMRWESAGAALAATHCKNEPQRVVFISWGKKKTLLT